MTYGLLFQFAAASAVLCDYVFNGAGILTVDTFLDCGF